MARRDSVSDLEIRVCGLKFPAWMVCKPLREEVRHLYDLELSLRSNVDYDATELSEWQAFLIQANTVWINPCLWRMMAKLFTLSIIVALVVFIASLDPNSLRVREFRLIGTYLNVFVAFLLGLAMSINLQRWLNCVSSLCRAFEAIRGLQVQLYALGATEERIHHILRYGVCACRLLTEKLYARGLNQLEQAEHIAAMWQDMQEGPFRLTEAEVQILGTKRQPSSLIWVWAGSLLGRMAQEGEIPPMPSPTFGSLVADCQTAQDSLRSVENEVSVQTPFIYVHTLAIVVHCNNILAAITFGLTLGASLGVVLAQGGVHWYVVTVEHTSEKPLAKVIENIIISVITCFVGPLLFQAFLLIGFSISAPFQMSEASIPTDTLLDRLENTLLEGSEVARNLPGGWEPPSFRPPPPKA